MTSSTDSLKLQILLCGGGVVAKSCLTLCDPMDYSLPGASTVNSIQITYISMN